MNINFNKDTIVAVIFIVCIIIAVISGNKNNSHSAVSFNVFDATEVVGHLGYIEQGTRYDYFNLLEQPTIFYSVRLNDIVPRGDNENGLRYGAAVGDSIIKYSYSDTLILIKKRTRIYYKIERLK